MAHENKRNAVIVCHEANDIKPAMENATETALPADDEANNSVREKNGNKEEEKDEEKEEEEEEK